MTGPSSLPDELAGSRAYLRINQTPEGIEVHPADMPTFERAQGVGRRLEPDLTPMPLEVAATSAAISLRSIAEDLSLIRHMLMHQIMEH